MAGTPPFKVYDGREYVASVKDPTLAAVLVGVALAGGTVKHTGRIIWREGREEFSAGESYDRAAEIMYDRVREFARERTERANRSWKATTAELRATGRLVVTDTGRPATVADLFSDETIEEATR